MDWIEQLFGVSPDGGDGTTEVLFIAAAIAVVAAIAWRVPRLRSYFRRAFARTGP